MDERMTNVELREARAVLGLSGERLAGRLGVRPDTLRRWESGRDPIPYALPGELLAVARERASELESFIARMTGSG